MDDSSVSIKYTLADLPACRPGRFINWYRPGLVSSKFSFNSASHFGWVKSPVPITWMPFLSAHKAMFPGLRSWEQALEYLEWICRSAMIRMAKLLKWLFACAGQGCRRRHHHRKR